MRPIPAQKVATSSDTSRTAPLTPSPTPAPQRGTAAPSACACAEPVARCGTGAGAWLSISRSRCAVRSTNARKLAVCRVRCVWLCGNVWGRVGV
eukprot:239441-Chlamydomonas_euryale.AAC.4